jgi:HlyD family secretion protein
MDQPLSQSNITKRRNSSRLKIVYALLVVASLLFFIHWLFTPSVKISSLRTAKVKISSIASTISAAGIVIPANESTLSSETKSKIIKVFVQVGKIVKIGESLLLLDTRALKLKIENIKENIALKDLKITTQTLRKNKAIHEIESKNQILEIELELRSVKAERLRLLSVTGAASKHALLEAEIVVKRTNIEIRQFEQSIKDHHSTSKAEIESLLLEKKILLKSLNENQRLIKNSLLVASRDGVLTWMKNEEGASVTIGEPLAKISDATQFRVEATLSDFYAPQLIQGMEVIVSYNQHNLVGHLETLSPTIENGVMKLTINLQQPDNKILHQNIRVNVGLITERAEQAKIILKGPFVSGKGLQNIFIIRDGVAYRTSVKIGFSDKDNYQIIGNVEQGDQVIISDTRRLAHLEKFTVN